MQYFPYVAVTDPCTSVCGGYPLVKICRSRGHSAHYEHIFPTHACPSWSAGACTLWKELVHPQRPSCRCGGHVCNDCHNCFHFGKTLHNIAIYVIEFCAVVYVLGSYDCFQHKAVAITGSMCFIGKLWLVLTLHEKTALRICYAFCYRPDLLFLLVCQIFL